MFQRDGAVEAQFDASAPSNVAMATELSNTSWSQRSSAGCGQDVELRAHQAQIVALARAEHHPMLAEPHRFRVAIDRDMPHREQAHAGGQDVRRSLDFVRPHLEADQRVGAEGVADARHRSHRGPAP